MSDSSSCDLHPENGGRFVLTRIGQDPLEYAIEIYLPQGLHLQTQLSWDDGQPRLEPAPSDTWARDEALKLSRVVRNGGRASLHRWRGR